MNIIKHIKSDWFRYGFETLAVIVGILAAFALESWHESSQIKKTERGLLIELRLNLQTNIENLEKDISTQERGAWCIDFVIEHLSSGKPYTDSLAYYLSEADYAPDVVLTSSAFETLKSYGLEIIDSDHLRSEVIRLFEVIYPTLMQETRRLEDQLWPAVVVPLYQKHFRRIGVKSIPTDYDALLKDTEFLNMLSFRGFLRKESTARKREVSHQTSEVIQLLDEELNGY